PAAEPMRTVVMLLIRLLPPPTPTLFPYTTLFRSPQVRRARPPPHRRAGEQRGVALGIGEDVLARRGEDCLGVAPHTRSEHAAPQDRKSTRLNSSHLVISYAVFCLKKKKQKRAGVL